MADLLSIGISGLRVSQTALSVTGNNIANTDTAGYSRQTVTQVSSASQQLGANYLGSGATITDVRRIYSDYLTTQVRTSTALDSEAQTYLTQINQVNSLLADSTTGISAVLESFFSALQTAAASPTDTASRQLLLTQSSTLGERFNSIYTQLSEQNGYINQQLSSMTQQVNSLASSVAQYNQAIITASASGSAPNDLLDQRDEAVRELSELIGVTVVEQGNSYNLFVGNGQPLVVGSSASQLSAVPSTDDPSRFALQLTQNGYATLDITSSVTGGQIGGLVRYREEVLDTTLNDLGRMALVVADQVNSQLGQGLDLNSELGASLFGNINDTTLQQQRSLAQVGNSDTTANLSVYIADTSQLSTSDYEVTFSSGTEYSVRRLSDGKDMGSYDLTTSPAPVIDGFSLQLDSGSVAAGDSFTILPTRFAAGDIAVSMTDSSQLAFAAPLEATLTSGNVGTGSITQPTLTTTVDIYDSAAIADMQTSLENGTPIKLVYDAASGGSQGYTLYDASGNSIGVGSIVPGQSNQVTVTVPANPPSVPSSYAFEMTLSGSPASGDSLTIAFNANGSSDNRNALAVLELQTANTVAVNGSSGMSLTTSYSSLIETVGAKTNQAKLDAAATEAILTQATSSQSSLSGVNLDEEAANLIKFEQYYTAASQIIQVARSTFDTLINSF
ncbi:flagellar hook-associated protein FlgK [Stutzerimonas kirkiae]|uniref:Flagellar hook-associated protein 1 n=1 Tax=Stutzerimonas kirkiae TaxID=2211392 RepID=A0A4Q9RE26_9GAMM|nr:flagellar hook-associated protein FlgK [Stutzerimonas kirkiae]TBU99976.1 flagellar hook-associated protein FlgK [Stutzerimonas kirkiae]TBV05682.1 flagellar hook-associated protein FlgK [Stutzerimonas kirkiae]TBV17433.1 flagellar hook-associated protein FlgK [Stutzerimonas kirkiae]